jgi:hypothetical protein
LAVPCPAVVTEMIKEVQEFGLLRVKPSHETFEGLRATQSS